MRARWVVVGAISLVLLASPATAGAQGNVHWQMWRHLSGVYDVGATRAGGLLVAAPDGLTAVDPGGALTGYARGSTGFTLGDASESYFVVAPDLHVATTGCDFTAGDVFILDLTAPLGVTRIDAAGRASRFAAITGADSLNGIAFDVTGRFDHRLLITGPKSGKTSVFAVDCAGTVSSVTASAPPMEGGIAVAPPGFGSFAGDLVAPDEGSDQIWAVAADGSSRLVATTGFPKGGDIGVESLGFVPAGFSSRGGYAYLADRGTAGNPHPGTDSILRLNATELSAAGVVDGDLLVATEGGGRSARVRCAPMCAAEMIGSAAASSHIEGHIAFTVAAISSAAPSGTLPPTAAHAPVEGPSPWVWAGVGAAALLAAGAAFALVRRRRAPRGAPRSG